LINEVRERGKKLVKRVKKNLDLVYRVRDCVWNCSREDIEMLLEELERRIGIPVFIDEGSDVYPSLVVNTIGLDERTIAWIELGKRGDYIEAIALVKLGMRVYAEPEWYRGRD